MMGFSCMKGAYVHTSRVHSRKNIVVPDIEVYHPHKKVSNPAKEI